MATKLNKSLPADADVTDDVPAEVPERTGPAPKSIETLDNGAVVETF